ncbi:MAG: hypothetical protein JWM47_4520 [Acidimicrobiales bacterium]|nr:hypothetical protein [Acidimicrobiales bacterium]
MTLSTKLTSVNLTLCSRCLDGAGGECHTPGCALWMTTAPDVPLRVNESDPLRVLLDAMADTMRGVLMQVNSGPPFRLGTAMKTQMREDLTAYDLLELDEVPRSRMTLSETTVHVTHAHQHGTGLALTVWRCECGTIALGTPEHHYLPRVHTHHWVRPVGQDSALRYVKWLKEVPFGASREPLVRPWDDPWVAR